MNWDSSLMKIKAGKISVNDVDISTLDVTQYDMLLARVDCNNHNLIRSLEVFNFRYVGVDFCLEAKPLALKNNFDQEKGFRLLTLERTTPTFKIEGFLINESRFMLDPYCKSRLPNHFWDKVIFEHCEEFSDYVICVIDDQERLTGFASCVKKIYNLDVVLFALHPKEQGKGLGSILINSVFKLAKELNLNVTTGVMNSNIAAFNFYLKHHFFIKSAEVVMHYWRKKHIYD